MSAEDLERYEAELELQLYREYRDVVGLFTYVVETDRRFYLTNEVEVASYGADSGDVYFEVTMSDAWVWDMYRPARFVKNVRVLTFKDVNVEEIGNDEFDSSDIPASEVVAAGFPQVTPLPRRTCARTTSGHPASPFRGRWPVKAKDAWGKYGEDVAAEHLRTQGFVVLEQNWRCRCR